MTDPAVMDALTELTTSVNDLATTLGQGWPLDKRETFAALVIMGLASRLQPLHMNDGKAAQLIAPLAFELADLAIVESAKEPKAK